MCSAFPAAEGVDLAALHGWDILVAEDAIASEKYAAEEFQSHFSEATRIKLPIVSKTGRPDQHVFIGAGISMRQSPVGFSIDGFCGEDLRIVVRDNNIAIAGGRPRGTLYGVYVFLEDYLGVRFLTTDHTHIPPVSGRHLVGPVDRTYRPPAALLRWSYYGEINYGDPAFAVRLRNNHVTHVKFGGQTAVRHINHSFYRQIPSQTYGSAHPEYYALIDGRRRSQVRSDGGAEGTQPCLANADVLRIVTESVLAELNPDKRLVSVTQNDNDRYCRCPRCLAVNEREGTPMGSILTFVNAVADEVGKEYPNALVGTLAYSYSREAPKTIKPRPNVLIQLSSAECCLIHPLPDPECRQNLRFYREMKAWGKICDRVSIWSYNTNFSNYLVPFPNLRVIEPNVRFFIENNVRGVFMQGAWNVFGGEMCELRNYMTSKLLWDPTQSGQDLMDEFLDHHYGKAAAPIRRFINHVHDWVAANLGHTRHMSCQDSGGIDASIAEAGIEAFSEALKLADDETVKMRVEKASICAYAAVLRPAVGWLWHLHDKSGLDPEVAKQLQPTLMAFLRLCEKHGVTRVSERENVEKARPRLLKLFGLPEDAE